MKDYTKNPLSEIPGGTTVKLVYANGGSSIHKNVKYPDKYVSKVLSEEGKNLVSAYDVLRDLILYGDSKAGKQTQIEF